MSQEHDIWFHLYKYGNIEPLEALKLYGCFRLASRINDLRRQGIKIKTIMIESSDGKRYAKYILEKSPTIN